MLAREGEELTSAEQLRVDQLLGSGKRYFNIAVAISLLSLAFTTLEEPPPFQIPFGEIVFPGFQTLFGMHTLALLLLVVSKRMFLMAYPWLRHDNRRPPFDWVVIGLATSTSYRIGAWFYVPVLLSSIGLGYGLGEPEAGSGALSAGLVLTVSIAVTRMPKSIYYWSYFVSSRLDERGGRATLSIYLLYSLRLLRQLFLISFLAYPLLLIVPAWSIIPIEDVMNLVAPVVLILYFKRWIGSTPAVYRRIDRLGLRFGFPVESRHYS